jgi:L-ascorbate metabolism protein UlaG (beta-lactamase superfamily)
LGGAGVAGIGALATMAYRTAPNFWKQYKDELGRPIQPPSHRPAVQRWSDRGLFAAWLGHTTVLLKIDGFTILTDPVFSDRAGLNLGPLTLGIKRLVAPALKLRQLPPVDLLLVSHAHMDHFDIPSLRALEGRSTSLITARQTSDLLRGDRYREARELCWGDSAQVGPVKVRAFEVNHWGARMRTDTYRGYNGYVIEAGRHRVLFAGDTAGTHLFRGLRGARPFDLAIMPVGAYNPWIHYHCTPEQAWEMVNEAGAEFVLPVHHSTFQLSREPLHEPLERLYYAAGKDTHRIAVSAIGQEFAWDAAT